MACDQADIKSKLPQNSGNPFLAQQAEQIATGAQENFERNVAPSLRGAQIQAGGYGGSRGDMATGLAAGEAQKGAINAITGMYSEDYQQGQNRALQQSMQSAQLAAQQAMQKANLDAQQRQFDADFGFRQKQFDTTTGQWNQQFDQQSMLQGLDIANRQAMMPYQQLQILSGLGGLLQGQDQAMLDANTRNFLNYAGILQPGAGLGQSTIQTGGTGSKAAGALGGAMSGASAGAALGPWGAAAGGIIGGIMGARG